MSLRWCLTCSTFFRIEETKVHKCYFSNKNLCEYQMCMIDERGAVIYFCSYCSNVSKVNQEVKCKAAEFSVITQDQISRPYFCSLLDCPLHPGFQTIFCTLHPDFKNASIIEYDIHVYNAVNNPSCPSINAGECMYCGTSPDTAAAYCHERSNVENLAQYLKKFPLIAPIHVKKAPNFITDVGVLNRNVSVINNFFLSLFYFV